MATKCKAKVDIGLDWKKGTEQTVDDGRAQLLKNSGWVDIVGDNPSNKEEK